MNIKQAQEFLLSHQDPKVRGAALVIEENQKSRVRVLELLKEAVAQTRLDMRYLLFDLECTRNERDALKP